MDKESFVGHIEKIQEVLCEKPELVKGIIDKIHIEFPRDENGHSEVEFYIFMQNFGKPSIDSDFKSPEVLYDELVLIHKK